MLCFEILPKTKYEIKIEALKSVLFSFVRMDCIEIKQEWRSGVGFIPRNIASFAPF